MFLKINTILTILFSIAIYGQEELPDNYLPIHFTIKNKELIGKSAFLEGFVFSMKIPMDTLTTIPKKEALYSLVKEHPIKGVLNYPNDKVTVIEYELVNHRGVTGIYMKTSLGYFMWEMLEVNDHDMFLAINWWYCPPATTTDLDILELAGSLLSNSKNWHQKDDRICDNDIESNSWSLFCALKHASIQKTKEYNHHNTAIQTVRFVIDELQPNHGYAHTLMDFNNNPSTTHTDILKVIEEAKTKLTAELMNLNSKG